MQGKLIIRIDDVVDVTPRLEALWRVLEKRRVPVHLGVIPADLTAAAAERLRQRAADSSARVTVQQHGYRHVNHGVDRRRFEFGDERDADLQREELAAGQKILKELLDGLFDGVFVPPWDRCGATTLDALAQLGFGGVSVIETSSAPLDERVPRVTMTIDPVAVWRPTAIHRPWDETSQQVLGELQTRGWSGIELHHEVMTDEDCEGLDALLSVVGPREFPTMAEAARSGIGPL
jgi:hypothetical protein